MAIKMDNYGNVYDDELFHYGVPGMKWGKNIMAGKNVKVSPGLWWQQSRPSGGFIPSNRKNRNKTSGGLGVHKRGSGLNTGPVGNKEGYSNRPVPVRPYGTANPSSRKPGDPILTKRSAEAAALRSGLLKPNPRKAFLIQNTIKADRGNVKAEISPYRGGKNLRVGMGAVYPKEINTNFSAKAAAKNRNTKAKKVGSSAAKASVALSQKMSVARNQGSINKAKKTVNRIFKKISKFFGW